MSLTVITHIWNEEFLLPFWIEHHRRIFDRCIVLDYGSTDRSLDILKSAGDWAEVRPSRNEVWYAEECDREVMEVEQEIEGWKCTLNTTEFYVCPDLRKRLAELPDHVMGVRSWGGVGIDPVGVDITILPNVPLLFQCHWGNFHHHDSFQRERVTHRAPHGGYSIGRHFTSVECVRIPDLFCLWLQFSPYKYVRERKIALQDRVPLTDKMKGYGLQHWKEIERLDEFFERDSRRYCMDLFEEPTYKRALMKMYWRKDAQSSDG